MERSCLVCRKRKIKCDRTPGTCDRCRAFGEQCVYSSPSQHGDQSVTQAGLKRRRILLSCMECKRSKVKCSGGAVCERCRRKGHECLYRRPGPDQQLRTASDSPVTVPMPSFIQSRVLPPLEQVRELLDTYFARIHTVRCMGFIHIPSFMERLPALHSGGSGLLFVMCALAAPFYYASIAGVEDTAVRFFDAGKAWAEKAAQSIFSDFGHLEIDSLMTAILLHEYYLRTGECSKAFLISGLIVRHIQVLQLNVEYDYDIHCHQSKISFAVKETRRRLLWTTYLLDTFIECGIDQLRLVSTADLQIQLPCLEDLFIRNVPCITEMLSGQILPFIDKSSTTETASNLDMRAFYIRGMAIRSRILRYVKNLEDEVPWENSQFQILETQLHDLETSLPETLRQCPENTYIFKASGRLNLYFGLHILIAQTYDDLYRVGVSGLVFPNSATKWIRQNAPAEFIARCHRTCASKAVHIAQSLKELWDCHRLSLVDIPYAVHAQICNSVLVTTLLSWSQPEPLLPTVSHQDYHIMLQTNVDILHFLQRYMKVDLYHESANQALERFKMFSPQIPLRIIEPQSDTTAPFIPPQFSLEYILNPLGTYPMARKQVDDRHEPHVNGPVASGRQEESPSLTGDGIIPSHLLDWEQDMTLMEGMGYPTFLSPVSIEDERVWSSLQRVD